jgi:peptide deformylase
MKTKKRKDRVTAKLIIAPNPILTQVCEPVAEGEDVSGIIRDMMYILTNSKTGVGLAAPQAGHLKRIILFRANGNVYSMVNPEYAPNPDGSKGPKEVLGEEGCLSYPGQLKDIWRFDSIDVCSRDELNVFQCNTFVGFTARIIQHEIDHLNGKCKVGESK